MPSHLKSFIGSIRKKPTKAADGRTDEATAGVALTQKTSILHDVTHLGIKNTKTLAHALPDLATGAPLDDKQESSTASLLLENGVSMLQSMPPNSSLSEKISDGFITMLWNDLPHPPRSWAGPTARYRSDDGSGNNPWNPEMGKAGTPYSRSVPPMKPKGPNLPSVEAVYEALLKRDGPFRPHPSGLNRLFFSFATVVIHECFQTNRKNQWINETSSYVDLSTLYGNNGEEQKRVRTYENGLIFPDSIASDRIMMMPPGVVTVLIMFSRNHNVIAEGLLSVNEEGKYKPWAELDKKKQTAQDEDIFQIARNINVAYFASVVLKDYVAAILNTPRANSEWSLNLGKEIKERGSRVERGSGNVVSVEFAVLYHWHAALSAADAQWMEDIIRRGNPGLEDIDDVTVGMFHKVMMEHALDLKKAPAREWTYGGLKRGPDGRFADADLAKIIKDCIEEPAHEFGAHGTPAALKVVDLLGQMQARGVFNVCTMNEFRRYLNLKPYESFDEWNPDPKVSRAAELLYGHIENLELYPGLMAECTKPAMPGSGVCPGQTTGRGILDDAVALVRGDRFLSYDFNSTTLTHWGAAQLTEGPPGSYGGMLPKLIFTGLPGEFNGTSPYALIPFYTPEAAKGILQGNKAIQKYVLERPGIGRNVVSVQTQAGCKTVFTDIENFRIPYQPLDGSKGGVQRLNSVPAVFFEDNFESNISTFFNTHVARLIEQNSLRVNKRKFSIDIVRDVTNIVPVLWLAERLAIPLKTREQPKGVISIWQTFNAFAVLNLYQNFNVLPVNEWKLRDGGVKGAEPLRAIFETHLKTQGGGAKEKVVDWMEKGGAFEVKPEADRLYKALINTKQPIGDLASDIISFSAPIASILSQQASLLIDLFLTPSYKPYMDRIIELSALSDAASERELQGFVFEGMRHAGVVPGLPRIAAKDITVEDGTRGCVNVKAGNLLLIATSKANIDPVAFIDPEKLNPHRDLTDYELLGHGLDVRMISASIAATLRQVFRLKGVRRADGRQGKFAVVERDLAGVKIRHYLDSSSKELPHPSSLTLEYDV